jgi:hypothetical protein
VELREQNFGIEIETTGITRESAARVIAAHFGTEMYNNGGVYGEYAALDREGRKWKVVYDGSIATECTTGRLRESVSSREYSAEIVSPICRYGDIPEIQQVVRELRAAGAVSNSSCGIHVHVDASPFTADKLRNVANIMASKGGSA